MPAWQIGFLQWADVPEPDEDAVALAQAWIDGEAPLVALRVRRGVRRSEIVEWVMDRFRVRSRSAGEGGEAATTSSRRANSMHVGLTPRSSKGLPSCSGARVADLLAWKPRPVAAQAAYYRENLELAAAAAPAPAAPAVPPDEVDQLFGVTV